MVVIIDKGDLYLELFPGPVVKNGTVVRREPIPGVSVVEFLSPPAKDKYGLFQGTPPRNTKEFRQVVRVVEPDHRRLQQILPPNALWGHARKGPRVDHLVHQVFFEGWSVKANHQVALQDQFVCVCVCVGSVRTSSSSGTGRRHDRFQLL